MDKTLDPDSPWVGKNERGSTWMIRFMILLCQHKYRWLVNGLLHPIVLYFLLTAGKSRTASRHFFINAIGKYSWKHHYRQLLCFSRSLVDRVSILMGESCQFDIQSQGREELINARKKNRGFILLGAHLGNFEACKIMVKDRADIDIHIVAYFGGSQKIRSQLDAINPQLSSNIIDPTTADAVFRMRDVIDEGGVLAILGDRTGIGEKKLRVDFLGESADLPAGPYYLSSILHCPVYCFFGLRAGDGIYHTYINKLADTVTLRRRHREEDAQVYAQAYADLLASKAKQYPYNWFNFFDFWARAKGEIP